MFKEILLFLSTFVLLNNHVETTKDPLTTNGRSVFVHLFEWKWSDIAKECERFLGPKGFGGVLLSPPNEHANVNSPYRPWWQRYQPVSYKLTSRSGSEIEFRDMVNRCNAVGVRIYVDAVINHMTSFCCESSGGSIFNVAQLNYADYKSADFNDVKCKTASGSIENFGDPDEVRNCRLYGLPDLATGSENVRTIIAGYLNGLIDMGVAGFRIDAAKNMYPNDLQAIYGKLKDVRTDIFGAGKRPFLFQEVVDFGNEPIKGSDYTDLGRVTEYLFGERLCEAINQVNNLKLRSVFNLVETSGLLKSNDAVSFVDNHDSQRGHHNGADVISFFEARKYKIANAFMLAWPYGLPQLMSSYYFDRNNDAQGPPSTGPNTNDVVINSDDTCAGDWICEHRWRQISHMVKFRNVAANEPVQNRWDNGANQIAFSRGNKAFIAINDETFGMDVRLQTGLPAGTYCDVISGDKVNNACTGKSVVVNNDGTAQITITYYLEDPLIAFHIDSKL